MSWSEMSADDPREGGEPIGELLGERGVFVEADASKLGKDVDRLVSLAVERGGAWT